jgi:hypothetical protein
MDLNECNKRLDEFEADMQAYRRQLPWRLAWVIAPVIGLTIMAKIVERLAPFWQDHPRQFILYFGISLATITLLLLLLCIGTILAIRYVFQYFGLWTRRPK